MKADWRFWGRVALKGILLFAVVNLTLGIWFPALGLARWSGYNHLFPGRARLPFGENPQQAYNLTLSNLDAMYASHEISGRPKGADTFRVVLIGDSSVWGVLLKPEETLAGQLNGLGLKLQDGRRVAFYNLGYPTLSVTKDLLVLDEALPSQPDLIIWLTTLEALPLDSQLQPPIVMQNAARTAALIQKYGLPLRVDDARLERPSWWAQTLIGQRRELADLARLQLYGVMWAATVIDQVYPTDFPRAQVDLSAEQAYHGMTEMTPDDLAFGVLAAGTRAAGETPVLLVNEPILISGGENRDVRYNFYYPRWAYDRYRALLGDFCQQQGADCLDAWDLIPGEDFTNTAIHINAAGTARLAQAVVGALRGMDLGLK